MKAVEGWPTRQLRELADIRVSNVDKKFYASEKPVKLCNYMDVYANEYVTDNIQFMEASATPAEIEQFSLNRGDVIITKDSETPDDIGIPAVIAEEINDLVCGYHLALIRPNQEYLDPVYLAKQLCTSDIVRYFAVKASGSTRFGLSIGAIETVEIPTPPKPEQTKIAEIFSTVDRAIEQTEALIAKQQRIKTGLMQDLLTRGIDDHGNLRSEQTHKFKDSPLGRIPVDWDVMKLSEATSKLITYGIVQPGGNVPDGVPFVQTKDLTRGQLESRLMNRTSHDIHSAYERSAIHTGDIVIGIRASVGFVAQVPKELNGTNISRGVARLSSSKRLLGRYLFWIVQAAHIQNSIKMEIKGSTYPEITLPALRNILIQVPNPDEQNKIAKSLDLSANQIRQIEFRLTKLRSLKTALMQDLLTGRKRVTTLLNNTEKITS